MSEAPTANAPAFASNEYNIIKHELDQLFALILALQQTDLDLLALLGGKEGSLDAEQIHTIISAD